MLNLLKNYIISLFVILNPFTTLVILLSLIPPGETRGFSRIALKTSLTVVIACFVTLALGQLTLDFLKVDLSALKAMGGVMLLLIALHMVQARTSETRHTESEAMEARGRDDISIIPLAIPVTFGPGTLTTILIYRSNSTVNDILALSAAFIINGALIFLVLRFAVRISTILKTTGINILVRIMGLMVGAIGVQFIVSGVKDLWNR